MVHYTVTVEVAPEVEAEWLPWYVDVHVAEVIAHPGFLRAVRSRDVETAADGWIRYVTRCEVEDQAALDRYLTGAAKTLRADYQQRFGKTTRLSRQVCVELGTSLPKR